MTRDPGELVSRYFDDLLTESEHRELQEWLRASPDHAREFARVALLHDRLRGEQSASSLAPLPRSEQPGITRPRLRPWKSLIFSAFVVAACVMMILLPTENSRTQAAAAMELKRLIAAQDAPLDRTYRIAVEAAPVRPRRRPDPRNGNRPPKPPLDDAILHVRKGNQFVLIRNMSEGKQFVTGSNGRTSWAVRPDGPVRVSSDLTRFNRDLPGHEHDIPLFQIGQSLAQLERTYDVRLLPIESAENAADDDSATRLLVAVKKPGNRGPQRVEITYAVRSGQIRQLRFLDMPYGPDHLTVRLTQEAEQPLGAAYFDHESHHAPDLIVEEE